MYLHQSCFSERLPTLITYTSRKEEHFLQSYHTPSQNEVDFTHILHPSRRYSSILSSAFAFPAHPTLLRKEETSHTYIINFSEKEDFPTLISYTLSEIYLDLEVRPRNTACFVSQRLSPINPISSTSAVSLVIEPNTNIPATDIDILNPSRSLVSQSYRFIERTRIDHNSRKYKFRTTCPRHAISSPTLPITRQSFIDILP